MSRSRSRCAPRAADGTRTAWLATHGHGRRPTSAASSGAPDSARHRSEVRHWTRAGRERAIAHVVHGPRRGASLLGAAPDGEGPPDRPAERVRPRRPLVAGPDGPLDVAAAGEAHALLARPLRDARPGHAAHAAPEPDAAAVRHGLLPAPAAAGHARPGDAALPLARRLPQGLAERELRPRAHGAVHARPRATPSATSARRPARSPGGASRAATGRSTAPGSTRSATTTASSASSGSAAGSARRRSSTSSSSARATPRSSCHEALGLLHHRAARPRHEARARADLPGLGPARSCPSSRTSCATARCTRSSTRPTWSRARSSTWPASCAARAQADHDGQLHVAARRTWGRRRSARRASRAGTGAPPWLTSGTIKARLDVANNLIGWGDDAVLDVPDTAGRPDLEPARAGRASRSPRSGTRGSPTRRAPILTNVAAHYFDDLTRPWQQDEEKVARAAMLQRTLRNLLLSGPDAHLH